MFLISLFSSSIFEKKNGRKKHLHFFIFEVV